MARRIHVFDPPDRFITGTIGEPGNRTFYLQAREGVRIASAVVEKAQVAVLAERLGTLLAELERRGLITAGGPVAGHPVAGDPVAGDPAAGLAADADPLDEPLNELFRVGTLTLGWDGRQRAVLVELRAQASDGDEAAAAELADDDPAGPDLIRVRLPAALARGFVERSMRVVAAGRPPCPLCGLPLEPTGHLCPRRNGSGPRLN
jgi:uncharacterized repeat protein (TIGR03847 family)